MMRSKKWSNQEI